MIRLHFELDGQEQLERQLEGDFERWQQLEALVLPVLGEALASALQENIRTEGSRLADRGITWPALHPVTVKIREHFGHPAKGPRLVRGGDLLRSIRVLRQGPSWIEAGSPLQAGAEVHFGGTIKGGARTIQAFPWALPSLQDLSDFEAMILDALEEPPGG